jgi:hypothetical protein
MPRRWYAGANRMSGMLPAASQSLSRTPSQPLARMVVSASAYRPFSHRASPASRTHYNGSRSHLGHRADRIKQRPFIRINARLITSAALVTRPSRPRP